MTADEIGQANETLREKSPLEVMEWAIGRAGLGGSGGGDAGDAFGGRPAGRDRDDVWRS